MMIVKKCMEIFLYEISKKHFLFSFSGFNKAFMHIFFLFQIFTSIFLPITFTIIIIIIRLILLIFEYIYLYLRLLILYGALVCQNVSVFRHSDDLKLEIGLHADTGHI